MVRCIVSNCGLSNLQWGEIIQTPAYLADRVPHAGLKCVTPYMAVYNEEANLDHIRVIGAMALVHTETYKRKLDRHASEERLVENGKNRKHLRMYNLATASGEVNGHNNPGNPAAAPHLGLEDDHVSRRLFTCGDEYDLVHDSPEYTLRLPRRSTMSRSLPSVVHVKHPSLNSVSRSFEGSQLSIYAYATGRSPSCSPRRQKTSLNRELQSEQNQRGDRQLHQR